MKFFKPKWQTALLILVVDVILYLFILENLFSKIPGPSAAEGVFGLILFLLIILSLIYLLISLIIFIISKIKK